MIDDAERRSLHTCISGVVVNGFAEGQVSCGKRAGFERQKGMFCSMKGPVW